jgi:hypothetical protein
MAGPTILAALNTDEFRAIAFNKSSLPTSSTIKDWRAGMSMDWTVPSTKAIITIKIYLAWSVHIRMVNAKAQSIKST